MATSNRIRALNRLPFDFEDGLKVGGVDVTNLNQAFTPAGAGLIGFTPVGNLSAGNVQAALAELDNEKVGFARLDDTDGSSLVGYDGSTAQSVLDTVKPIIDYAALRTYAGTATHVRIIDYDVSGFFYYDSVDTSSIDNGGTIIVSSNGKRWKRVYHGEVSVRWFGAKGNGSADDTVAIQKAIDADYRVYVPPGNYRVGTLYLRSNSVFYGAGASSVLQALNASTIYILATNAYSLGTSNPADNKKSIYVSNLTLDGRKRDLGFNGFVHAMTINATTDMVVEKVTFYDFRGDGCYVGAGTSNGLDRKNINIAFVSCVFDGKVKDVRNGLSVIDCDGLIIDKCVFKNIGAPGSSQSVGAIDFEPNNPWNTYRNVSITGCTFDEIDTTNSAAISLWTGNQVGNDNNIFNCKIINNIFRRCVVGVGVNSRAKNAGSQDDTFVISENHFLDTINLDINLGGSKNSKICNNTFELSSPGSAAYRGGIRVGLSSSGQALNAIDTLILGNTFTGIRPQSGVIWLNGAVNCKIENNTFNDVSGAVIDFYSPSVAGLNQNLNNISIRNNTVNNRLKYAQVPVTTSYFIRQGTNLNNGTTNNTIISANCFEENNILNDGVPRLPGGSSIAFRGEVRSTAPVAGSWEQGNIVFDSIPAAGAFAFACSVSGTFGTFTNAPTGQATSGSGTVTSIVDPDVALRSGQWITLTGDAVAKKIIAVDYGKVISVDVTNGGSGYVDGQLVVFALTSAVRGTGIATVVGGAITAITIVDGGVNFVTGNVVKIESATSPSGINATGTVTARTDVYLSGNFTGTTGSVTFAWSNPTFVVA